MFRKLGWIPCLSLLLPTPPLGAEGTDVAPFEYRITQIEGSVLFKGVHDKSWVSAEVDQILSDGDQVKTMQDSRAEIATPNPDIIQLDENSTFLAQTTSEDETSFSLIAGKFFFNIFAKKDRKFQIKTPLSVLSVRGTELAVYQTSADEWEGGVIEGTVAVRALAETEGTDVEESLVQKEEGFRFQRGQKTARFRGLPPRMAAFRARFESMRQRKPAVRREWKKRIIRDGRNKRRAAQRSPAPRPRRR
ncbi:MAG TPA: FecR family protein [Elusimicrobiota bacterium]|nr:FecR family protein [Elusimicrobiota bacterium]